jgi:threonine/homoserine/homoserine lactone efflux protein
MIEILARGWVLGLAIAAPVGPIGILCIRRTIHSGCWAGFVSGMGAATADAIYGSIAGFGLTFVSQWLIDQSLWLRWLGGAFLCYLGIKTIVSTAKPDELSVDSRELAGMYASTLALTITNPATILSFVAVFAGLGLATNGADYRSAIALVAGVFLGSASWWLVLSSGAHLLRDRLSRRLVWINRASGIILLIFGIVALNL